jgi:hypothetical protein
MLEVPDNIGNLYRVRVSTIQLSWIRHKPSKSAEASKGVTLTLTGVEENRIAFQDALGAFWVLQGLPQIMPDRAGSPDRPVS